MSNTLALIAFGLVAGAMVLVASSTPDEAALRRMSARFAPVDIAADVTALPAGEKRALAKLVEAGRLMDALFLRQVWAGNESLFMELVADASNGDAAARARLDYFLINKGPWSRLDHNQAFVAGAPAETGGRELLSCGCHQSRRRTVGRRVAGRGAESVRSASSPPSAERHRAAQPFAIVPYSLEYQGELAHAASLLREAAAARPMRR